MVPIESGVTVRLPKAKPGEEIYILTFVVTKAGWKEFIKQLDLQPNNPVRIVSQLFYQGALSGDAEMSIDIRQLKDNHAKLILYRKQKLAILGSFNLTRKSFTKNVESYVSANTDYEALERTFRNYWDKADADVQEMPREKAPEELARALGGCEDEDEEDEEDIDAQTDSDEESALPYARQGKRLHDYQETIVNKILSWFKGPRSDDRGKIVTLPTGAGKTLVAAGVVHNLLKENPNARVLWVCHRVELVRQGYETCRNQVGELVRKARWFLPNYIENESCGGLTREEYQRSRNCQLVFCTSGTVPGIINRQGPFDLVVVDECHRFHLKSKRYKFLHAYCKSRNIPRLGLTATPLDADERRFDTYWDTELMYGQEFEEKDLVQKGFLSKKNEDLTKCWETGFQFILGRNARDCEDELIRRVREFDDPQVNTAVKQAWDEYRNRRTRVLCFAVTCEHADTLKNTYFGNDDSVQVIHSKQKRTSDHRTPKQDALEWFRSSEEGARMLISVLILTEGVDLPKTDCLFLVRPTFSDELHKQMMGRGLRGLKSGGTEDCAFVDFTYQFVTADGTVKKQATASTDLEPEAGNDNEDTPDTLGEAREWVRARQQDGYTKRAACEELAEELDYSPNTLYQYISSTRPDDYPLVFEDDTDESVGTQPDSAVRITKGRLLDLCFDDPRQFETIASLTGVAPTTLQNYCYREEAFDNWKRNNRYKLEQIREILARSLKEERDAA